jgi:hypothetical protein
MTQNDEFTVAVRHLDLPPGEPRRGTESSYPSPLCRPLRPRWTRPPPRRRRCEAKLGRNMSLSGRLCHPERSEGSMGQTMDPSLRSRWHRVCCKPVLFPRVCAAAREQLQQPIGSTLWPAAGENDIAAGYVSGSKWTGTQRRSLKPRVVAAGSFRIAVATLFGRACRAWI